MTEEARQILTKIELIVRDELDDDSIVLTTATRAVDVYGWDSISHITIMIAIERAFGVEFKTDEITNVKNVGELVELVRAAR